MIKIMCAYSLQFLGWNRGLFSWYFYLQGQFIGVVGKVGSGKSSLLAAITAEMNITQGEVCVFCM